MKTRIGQTVEFGRDGDARDYQAYGWSLPEDGYNWTDGPAAGLVVPLPEAPHGFFIELFFWVNGGADATGSQRIIASVNGRPIGQATAYGRMRLVFRAPRLAPTDSRVIINLELPDAARPAHRKDDRVLGLAVMSLRIMPLLEAVPAFNARTCAIPLAADDKSAVELAQRITGLTIADIAMKIESLGFNCEPGFFQRKCGVEPLGLLRFAGVIIHKLIASIDDGFAELGNTATIDPIPDELGLKDWVVYERRHTLRYHTWVRIGDATAETIREREAKKLPFLKNKFFEDIEDGTKIFVHQHNRIMPDAEILALFLAIRRRGPGALLCIGPADDAHQPGLVEEIYPGLMRGYFGHFSSLANGRELSMPEWLAVCANALTLRNNLTLAKAS
jgi:hypothetical protein